MELIIGLIGVVLGWLLSQGTDVIKAYVSRKKKINAIYTELSDVNAWLSRMKQGLKYNLQLMVLEEQATSIPAKIHTFIFDNYFFEICVYLSNDVRVGFTDIYDSISVINEQIDQMKELIDTGDENDLEPLIRKTDALYAGVYMTHFKTSLLLSNKKLDMAKLKGVVPNLHKSLSNEIEDLVNEAKSKGIDTIKTEYYAE